MDEKLKIKLQEIRSKAKNSNYKAKKSRTKSSLHGIIKTKEQAERLMRQLHSA